MKVINGLITIGLLIALTLIFYPKVSNYIDIKTIEKQEKTRYNQRKQGAISKHEKAKHKAREENERQRKNAMQQQEKTRGNASKHEKVRGVSLEVWERS